MRAAVGTAGLWDELDTGWLLLDCELLPWSAKAEDLLRHQYAAVGAAARAALPAAVARCSARPPRGGSTSTGLAGRTTARAANAEAFTAAYRRYCWPIGRPGRGSAGPVPGAGHRGRRPPRAVITAGTSSLADRLVGCRTRADHR